MLDWPTWAPTIRANLCFILKDEKLLLIRKKRGLGAGKINGPGGKLDPGENALESAIRETEEELGVIPIQPLLVGELLFEFRDGLLLQCSVFLARDYTGEARETVEAVPLWTALNAIPYEEMWEDDRYWLPLVVAGKKFRAFFVFDGEKLLERRVEVVNEPSDSETTR